MEAIDFWRLADELTVVQATILICGCDPSDYKGLIGQYGAIMPEGFDAAKHALLSAVASYRLSVRLLYTTDDHGENCVVDDLAQIKVSDIREWLSEKGFKEHFFFLPFEPEDEFLSTSHPRYSAKLAASVTAWRALDNSNLTSLYAL